MDREMGGAWHCAVRTLAGKSRTSEARKAVRASTKTGEKDSASAEAGCRKGECMEGIVLQHSWLCSWPSDEHGMVLQHCMAASGVDMAEQAKA